ncbi:hypothetical protein V12B01_12940 [Vibrio splendidus 12B01]|nr:hypothetical protein V12B01_12940 [Vibrio splendidus 12B01]
MGLAPLLYVLVLLQRHNLVDTRPR